MRYSTYVRRAMCAIFIVYYFGGFMKKGLRENFLFPTVCLILIGLAVTSYVSYYNAKTMMVDSVNDQLRQNTESIRDFVVSWSENRRRDVALWASQSSIGLAIGMIGDDTDGTEGLSGSGVLVNEVNEDLRKYAQANPDYAEIGIASPSGSVLTSSLIVMEYGLGCPRGGWRAYRGAAGTLVLRTILKPPCRGSDFVSKVRLNPDTDKPVFVLHLRFSLTAQARSLIRSVYCTP